MSAINSQQACIEDNESFFQTCEALKPALIFFFGRELSWAFASAALSSKVEPIFGAREGEINWVQKDVYFNGIPRRRLRFGFQQYERLTVVVLPHATGAQGVASDYIEAFKSEMAKIIGDWWTKHLEKLATHSTEVC
jgi:hypothetical protein